MAYSQLKVFLGQFQGFSSRTLILGAVFIACCIIATFVDLDALLDYYKVLAGSAQTTLETAAAISIGCGVPFLAMGMSISADSHRERHNDR